jgi:hypothetical protein
MSVQKVILDLLGHGANSGRSEDLETVDRLVLKATWVTLVRMDHPELQANLVKMANVEKTVR